MKFKAMLLFMALWVLIVYFQWPTWFGKGGLLNAYLGGKIPSFDFAGGTVVHVTREFRRWFARCTWASASLSG